MNPEQDRSKTTRFAERDAAAGAIGLRMGRAFLIGGDHGSGLDRSTVHDSETIDNPENDEVSNVHSWSKRERNLCNRKKSEIIMIGCKHRYLGKYILYSGKCCRFFVGNHLATHEACTPLSVHVCGKSLQANSNVSQICKYCETYAL